MDELFGLPAHPLLVHAAVVLVPLAAIGTVAAAALPRHRKVLAPIMLGLAVLGLASVFFAKESGEKLDERLDEDSEALEEHEEAAETVLPFAFLLTVAAGAVTFADPIRGRLGDRVSAKAATAGLVAFSVLSGVVATATVVRTGHTGAESVWGEEGDEGGEGQQYESGDDDRDDGADDDDD